MFAQPQDAQSRFVQESFILRLVTMCFGTFIYFYHNGFCYPGAENDLIIYS